MTWAVVVIVLMVAGLLLLAAEIFVIPGFGLTGALGVAAVIAAGVIAWTQLGATYGLASFGGGIVLTGVFLWLLPRTRAGKALVLSDASPGRAGSAELTALAGKAGRAVTPLRPAGTADIDGRSVDVVTDGLYVEQGKRIRVARVEGVRVIVEPEPHPEEEEETRGRV